MSKDNLYWLAVGVVSIGEKEYGAGMPLPVDKIDKDVLNRWLAAKPPKVGKMVAEVGATCKDCAGHLDTIQAKNDLIDGLKAEVELLTDKVVKKTSKSGDKK